MAHAARAGDPATQKVHVIPLVAVIAAACMAVTDVLFTCMTLAQASGRGWIAGVLDAAGWYVGIVTTTISVESLGGHSLTRKIWVLVLVGAANVLGTQLGEETGKWLLKRLGVATVESLASRVAALERKAAS